MLNGIFWRRILLLLLASRLALFAGSSSLAAEDDAPSHTIEGTVVDEADKPVAGAKISGTSGWAEHATTSNEKGQFRLQVKPGPQGAVNAQLEARSTDGRLSFLSVYQQNPEPVRLVVKPARELAVAVSGADGKPIAMAEVEFHSSMRRLIRGVTDEQGRWTCRVPADSERWAVLARKPGVGFDYATAERSRGSIEKLHPLPAEIALKLDGARTIKVKAVDQAGEPIAGVRIGAWYLKKPNYEADINLSGTLDNYPLTGADGTVVLDWLPKEVHQGYSIIYRAENHFAHDHTFFIPADQPVEELTINLLPLAELKGRVTHADGSPAAKIAVHAQGQGAGQNRFLGMAATDADGRYKLRVYTEQAYVITAGNKTWAASYRGDVVVRAGQQPDDVDFVLGPATKVSGRVTVGKDNRPAEKAYVYLHINKGQIPDELRKKDDRFYHPVSMQLNSSIDTDGRFEFAVGPGEYQLSGPVRGQPIKLTIPAAETPQEIVQDFHLPRPLTGPFSVQVHGPDGKPAAGAILYGRYASQSATRLIQESKVDERGTLAFERALEAMVLHARSADRQLAGVARIDEEAKEGQVVLTPTASATGRLLNLAGQPLAEKQLTCGIRIYLGEPERSPFSDSFGGSVTSDADGRFTLRGLVAGEVYHVSMRIDDRSSRTVTQFAAKNEPLSLGDVRVDPNPIKPYVPPTASERTAEAFTAKRAIAPQQRLETV
jgi:hypothetical protein